METSREQTSITEQGQFTERFTQATDQLDRGGNDHLQARLGGIYALERLSRDSPRDQPTIVELLTAFIRTTAKRQFSVKAGNGNGCVQLTSITPDVQAALTVLGRRDTTNDSPFRLDLSATCLGMAHANGRTQFARTNFRNAELYNANLEYVELAGANFSGADLSGADLAGADLTGADFTGADLHAADLETAALRGANFTGANLAGAYLGRAAHDEWTQVTGTTVDSNTRGAWW